MLIQHFNNVLLLVSSTFLIGFSEHLLKGELGLSVVLHLLLESSGIFLVLGCRNLLNRPLFEFSHVLPDV